MNGPNWSVVAHDLYWLIRSRLKFTRLKLSFREFEDVSKLFRFGVCCICGFWICDKFSPQTSRFSIFQIKTAFPKRFML